MIQLYVLSIVVNILAGIVVAWDFLEDKLNLASVFNPEAMRAQPLRLVLGASAFIVGFLKLLIAMDVVIVGDLLPALIGMIMGMILIVQYYRERSEISSDIIKTIESVFVDHASVFGVLGIVISLVHLILAQAIFL